jgi:Uma2 family endonuclease
MSPAAAFDVPDDIELISSDGEPLDSPWHRHEIDLFTHLVAQAMAARGKRDFYVGGDMFIYYSPDQARGIVADPHTRKHFKGPDVFFVDGVDPREREYWVIWEERGRCPDVILELLSPSTAAADLGAKKDLYEQTFRTPEYFYYDRYEDKLGGFRLQDGLYVPLEPNAAGRLRSEELGLELGRWRGVYEGVEGTWIRLFHPDGRLVLRAEEAASQRADAERQRADAERHRAEDAEIEVARLKTLLAELRDKSG